MLCYRTTLNRPFLQCPGSGLFCEVLISDELSKAGQDGAGDAISGREGKNDFIPEDAGFLCSDGLYLRVDKLVFNQGKPLYSPAGCVVNWCHLAIQLPYGAAGFSILNGDF